MAVIDRLKPWWAVVIGLTLLALWTARPIGVDAPHHVDTSFDADRAIARLTDILGDQRPHPTDSDASDAVEARLLAAIRQEGFTPLIDERFHCNDFREGAAICSRPRNIAFWVTPPGDDAVMIVSHHDSVAAGPGAADDGIGMAVALELAAELKGRKLARPILVLITDAEEAGLIGAAAFAAHDPLRKRVGAVINIEARGTTGGVNMFQTSSPNARDIATLGGDPLPFANSMSADFYGLLPNDTDLTMLLPLGVDAGNYSVIGGGKRYHTPLDNLAHLDRNSVRHMGATTLAAVEGFASGTSQGAEGQRIYTDLARTILLAMPQVVALVVLVAGLAAALFLFWSSGKTGRVRAIFAPLLALVVGTLVAFAAGWLVAAIRSDAAFGTAYPMVFRLLYGAAGLAGAAAVLALLRPEEDGRGVSAAWIWLAIPVLGVFAFVPGLSIVAIWPMTFVIAAAVASPIAAARRAVPFLLIGAAILFVLIVLPLAGGLEEGLFVESAAPSAMLLIFMFLFFMPGVGARVGRASAVFAMVMVPAFVAALWVPAYSAEAPRHLSVVHEEDNGKAAFLIEDNGPLPETMRAAAAFAAAPDDKGNWHAPAPKLADDGTVEIASDTRTGDRRMLRFVVSSPTSDRQELLIREGEGIKRIVVNGARPAVRGKPAYIGCTGRSCRRLDVELELSAKAKLPELSWRRTWYGAGAAAQKLVAKRPATAQPVHTGDRRVLIRPIRLPAPPAAAAR